MGRAMLPRYNVNALREPCADHFCAIIRMWPLRSSAYAMQDTSKPGKIFRITEKSSGSGCLESLTCYRSAAPRLPLEFCSDEPIRTPEVGTSHA
jgi:hypothetical protein